MRILHVIGGLERAGAETWLVQVLEHIDRNRYKFDFEVHTEQIGYYEGEVRSLGGNIIRCLGPSNPLKYGRNFLRILKENGPYDCVHSHVQHFSGYVVLLAAMARVPIRITHSHTGQLESQVSPVRWAYLRIMEILVRG